MGENISKLLYLGFGVILLVLGLSVFYSNNQSFFRFNQEYEARKVSKDSWLVEPTRVNRNPLGISVTDPSLIRTGLVFKGHEVKNQLLVMMNTNHEYTLYKDGSKVLMSDYVSLYESVEDTDQVLITYNHETKSVYMVTL